MSILVNKDTKLICQGFTGSQGTFHSSAFCILTKDGIKWLENSTRQYLPSFEARVQVYAYSSLAFISNKQKKRDNSSQDFYKKTLASERILCGALCILAKDGIKWLENEE